MQRWRAQVFPFVDHGGAGKRSRSALGSGAEIGPHPETM
jgi:hypothetical protein